jgi:flavin reductase (DIM6/NTAB) family NADH-FMN oxidoreductase RutF
MTLPEDFLSGLRGMLPSMIATCAADGTPNVTTVSQLFPAGPGEVAISNQFLSKTHRNLLENPRAMIALLSVPTGQWWWADVRHLRTETEGELFDTMEMELEALASVSGMSGIFKLQAADVFEVLSVTCAYSVSTPG